MPVQTESKPNILSVKQSKDRLSTNGIEQFFTHTPVQTEYKPNILSVKQSKDRLSTNG
jgi:hypothetical protein